VLYLSEDLSGFGTAYPAPVLEANDTYSSLEIVHSELVEEVLEDGIDSDDNLDVAAASYGEMTGVSGGSTILYSLSLPIPLATFLEGDLEQDYIQDTADTGMMGTGGVTLLDITEGSTVVRTSVSFEYDNDDGAHVLTGYLLAFPKHIFSGELFDLIGDGDIFLSEPIVITIPDAQSDGGGGDILITAAVAAVTSLVVLVLGAIAFYCCYKQRKKRRKRESETAGMAETRSSKAGHSDEGDKDIELAGAWMPSSASDARWLIEWDELLFETGEENCIIGHGANGCVENQPMLHRHVSNLNPVSELKRGRVLAGKC